ncbi:DUF3095 family protein [Magnetospirillum sp. UT-4]|uniref:DUF3095 family protein n=1 Tax=Magnetospirillum sp. UT-4 TaxID=2681467 RepID=UPI00137CAB3B|nr:DUF3095 family protein [Magnetospirillum sp. UT-4]CAA7626448.1 conserved hypothetical protein [Magnetospirillum sp. UT-4]
MHLPAIRDFAAEAHDPGRYARLAGEWWIAAADVVASTRLAEAGRDRDVNFVAGAVVAALSAAAALPDQPAACQFGGDGAIAAVPPQRLDQVRQAMSALAHWSDTEMQVPLRVGLVPVAALEAEGHQVLVALHDFGNCNVFGQFLGSGAGVAESWIKAGGRWHVAPAPGPIPGLEGLSCRWRPVPARRGAIMCLIVDPLRPGAEGMAVLARLQGELNRIVAFGTAAPLGDGGDLAPVVVPSAGALAAEARTASGGHRALKVLRALAGSAILGLVHRLGGKVAGVDTDAYRRGVAQRSDYCKQAGGPRFVLDVTDAEAAAIVTLLDAAERAGDIRYGLSRATATTLTCMVGDFAADRHVHFVDGDGLGFWRASVMLKAKRSDPPPAG